MAFLDTSGASPRLPYFYNVEQAVGPTGVNARGDVMLVQYLLNGIYAPKGPTVDGWIGPITNAYIKSFQAEMRKRRVDVAADGRVDRAMSERSSISKTVYTIMVLNKSLQSIDPKAYELLPYRVPLNASPRTNPYNPATASGKPAPVEEWGHQLIAGGPYIVEKILVVSNAGRQYYFVWNDGTKTPASPIVQYNH